MIKVSITLPNNAQITFETEEAEVIREVVGMVLRDLPRDLVSGTYMGNGATTPSVCTEKGNDVPMRTTPEAATPTPPHAPGSDGAEQPPIDGQPSPPDVEAFPSHEDDAAEEAPPEEAPPKEAPPEEAPPNEAERRFIQYCLAANPTGDMRRVVVAAEGASRHLQQFSVDAARLERLFRLAGWPLAHSFVQTLRNSARTKFRWMERVPGRSGHYTVTDIGRAAIGLDD